MSSKKKEQTFPGYYVTVKNLRDKKKHGAKPSRIRMELSLIDINEEIIKNRKSKFPNL